jgi:hypothetical protein
VYDQDVEKRDQDPTIGCTSIDNDDVMMKIIGYISLLFMCRVNSYKANYRQRNADIHKYIIIIILIHSSGMREAGWS